MGCRISEDLARCPIAEEIVSAIASVLIPLHQRGSRFSLSQADWLQRLKRGRGNELGKKYIIQSETYIIPLLLELEDVFEEDAEGNVNRDIEEPARPVPPNVEDHDDVHVILAVATKVGTEESGTRYTQVRFFDSSPMSTRRDRARYAVHETIRQSNWNGGAGDARWWGYENWEPVVQHARQAYDRERNENYSGIHTILNAWTIMLGLDPLPEPWTFPSQNTYRSAASLINEAMAGVVDLDRIKAWLVCNRFAKPTVFRVGDDHDAMFTVEMNSGWLRYFADLMKVEFS